MQVGVAPVQPGLGGRSRLRQGQRQGGGEQQRETGRAVSWHGAVPLTGAGTGWVPAGAIVMVWAEDSRIHRGCHDGVERSRRGFSAGRRLSCHGSVRDTGALAAGDGVQGLLQHSRRP